MINFNEIRADIPDYKSFTHLQLLNELKDILNVKNPVKKDARNEEISLEEIAIIILVIMMSETGCGKTLLISKLSEMLNDGKFKMNIKNIHSGFSERKIINFINDEVINEAISLEEEEKKTI